MGGAGRVFVFRNRIYIWLWVAIPSIWVLGTLGRGAGDFVSNWTVHVSNIIACGLRLKVGANVLHTFWAQAISPGAQSAYITSTLGLQYSLTA